LIANGVAVSQPGRLKLLACRSPLQRLRGLAGRRRLRPDSGICLWPCRAVHTWGMRMVIDVAFLDGEGRVVKRVARLAPGRWAGCWRARMAVEVAAGTLAAGAEADERIEQAVARLLLPKITRKARLAP
jgi:uncharacterized membrane protein (UPF0127 family)